MPKVTYDGQSLSIDNRRVWLTSGALYNCRVPRELWRSRIQAAKQAGLNCIETYLFWNAHEPRPGEFDFTGRLDIRAFLEMLREEGMYCILRPGPYSCSEWDFGGMPSWLHEYEPRRKSDQPLQIRVKNEPYLEGVSRYFTKLFEQVKDLQITEPSTTGKHNPLLMVQVENEWFCDNQAAGLAYFEELIRYMKLNGVTVPLIDCNNLNLNPDTTIHCWNESRHLPFDLRQLAIVQPDAPRIVSEYWTGWFDAWGKKFDPTVPADLHEYRLAGILSAGAMPNLYMFHGGTNFGFYAGRTVGSPTQYMITSYDFDSPLGESGQRTEKFYTTKRVLTFANHFGNVFANLEPDHHNVAVAPDESEHPVSVISQKGSAGNVTFLLRSEKDRTKSVNLILANGLKLPVHLGKDRTAWFLTNTKLAGVATLDFTNLRPWAFIDQKLLVLFGPAGTEGIVSIDSAVASVQVPKGKKPNILTLGEIEVVICNREQIDATYIDDNQLYVGCDGINEAGEPYVETRNSSVTIIDTSGKTITQKLTAPRKPNPIKLNNWSQAQPVELFELENESINWQPLEGPTSHEKLGNSFGYGIYRIEGLPAKQSKLLIPEAADRLHLYNAKNGTPLAYLGEDLGTTYEPVNLKLPNDLVVLSDNLGRFNFGNDMGDLRGIFGDLYHVTQKKLPKLTREDVPNVDPYVLRDFITNWFKNERQTAEIATFKVTLSATKSTILECKDGNVDFVLFLNDKPVDLYSSKHGACRKRWVFNAKSEHAKSGSNTIKLAFRRKLERSEKPASFLTLYEGVSLSSKAKWSFTTLATPSDDAFAAVPAKAKSTKQASWFKVQFEVKDNTQPLWFEPLGLTKGQLYLNGQNVGRYFVATASGKTIPPQSRYYLPEPWLNTDGPNELLIFEEHGNLPTKAKLTYGGNAYGL